MKKLSDARVREIRKWVYRNARPVDLALWKCVFEGAPLTEFTDALWVYQNPDGGFGHALEADNWNPASSPCETRRAIEMIHMTGKSLPKNSKLARDIIAYYEKSEDYGAGGWQFCVPSTNDYPHAPWWTFNGTADTPENIGVTIDISAFIVQYGDADSPLVKRAWADIDRALSLPDRDEFGEMGVGAYLHLLSACPEKAEKYRARIEQIAKDAIVRDPSRWGTHCVKPSQYIQSPESPLYAGNEQIVDTELDYLVDTLPEDDVWPIDWTWFDNMEKYGAQFRVAENWWKAEGAMEKLLFLRAFGRA